MQLLRLPAFVVALCATTNAFTLGRVRDVNHERNQVTVFTNKAGEFAIGQTVYFFRGGKSTGNAKVSMTFHTKAIGRITQGNPQTGDDASPVNKAPKAGPIVSRVSFGATNIQAHEFMVEVAFENQEKQDRKLAFNAEIAAQLEGAPGYIGLNASLLKEIQVVWKDGALHVEKVKLSDRSSFNLKNFVAADLYAKIKPAAETRSQTVKGKITVKKKSRDLNQLVDGIEIVMKASAKSERMKAGKAYKLKAYCNELFASEFILRPQGSDISETLMLSPVDLAPAENTLEFRLVEVTEQGELMLETDNNQMIGTLAVENGRSDQNARVHVTIAQGQNAFVNQAKSP